MTCDCCQQERPILVATLAVELCAPCAVDELERQVECDEDARC